MAATPVGKLAPGTLFLYVDTDPDATLRIAKVLAHTGRGTVSIENENGRVEAISGSFLVTTD